MTPAGRGSGRSGPVRRSGRPKGNTTAATRAGLLRSAREVFAERGYEGASTTEIVERAGVANSVLYHHFGSKAALYLAALAEVLDSVIGTYETAITGLDTVADRLDAVLNEMPDLLAGEPHVGSFTASAATEVRRHPELRAAVPHLRRLRALAGRIAIGSPEEQASGSSAAAHVCEVVILGLTDIAANTGGGEEFDDAVAAVRTFVTATFRSGTAGARPSDPGVPRS